MNNYICPICDSMDINMFMNIKQIPVYCNVLYKSRDEAITADRADMTLGYCEKCGHVYNFDFDPSKMNYSQDYENSLHFSPRFQQYAENLARNIIRSHQLFEKDIIEIGCGDGNFLELLCKLGNNRGVGFDPSHVPNLDKTDGKNNITFIRDYYSQKYSNFKADLICCRHVLEHIQYPRSFLDTIHTAIGASRKSVVFFEVPNVLYTLKDLGIWDLIYEHCSYFSPFSLRAAFCSSGFELLNETETFKGQFLVIEAKQAEKIVRSNEQEKNSTLKDLEKYVLEFNENFTSKISKWRDELKRLQMAGKTAVVWGAGSKGVTFLNILETKEQLKYVIDINPRKQGKFIAGTGQEIVSQDLLRNIRPDEIIVMNPVYIEEIRRMVGDLGITPEFKPV